MIYTHRTMVFLYLCNSVFLNGSNLERTKTMNEKIEANWLTTLQKTAKSGLFQTKDKYGKPIILEWNKIGMLTQEFSALMENIWDIACAAYTPVEMKFLKAFPQVVEKEAYFKPFEHFFEQGLKAVDWSLVEIKMQETLKSHFVFDVAKLPEQVIKTYARDICIFIQAKDMQTNAILGFITFMIRPNYPIGNVKVITFAVSPSAQNRGLGKLLMSSIFNIVTGIKRIFLCTRVTNEQALSAYRSWGFTNDINPIMDHPFNMEHWTFMECNAEQSDILQKVARTLK